jgi:glycosyltransferase involved in cell wall biosynthesis
MNKVNNLLKKNALIVIGRLSYPGGTAASNRVHLYCKSLKKENGFPFVINLHSTFTKPQKFNYLGKHDGIPFLYAQKTPLWEKRLLVRNLKKIKGLFNTVFVLWKIKKKHHLKVLFYATEAWDELFLFVFLKMMKISIIRDCSEIPSFIRDERKALKIHTFFLRLRVKMYNDLIVISDHLNSFYSAIFPKKRIFQIPILVDMDRFTNIEAKEHAGKIITYVGSMGGNKDGLQNLIEAMALVNKNNKNTHLHLVGSASEDDMSRLKNKVKKSGLENTISFLGKRNADEIPAILSNSDLLVLARPDNEQAKAGFPTKLGEYLACAKPIVITITGEIPKYLKHNVSAYLAKPGDVSDFAEKVVFALSDENSAAIGKKGYEVANNNFNYQLYGKKICEILQS